MVKTMNPAMGTITRQVLGSQMAQAQIELITPTTPPGVSTNTFPMPRITTGSMASTTLPPNDTAHTLESNTQLQLPETDGIDFTKPIFMEGQGDGRSNDSSPSLILDNAALVAPEPETTGADEINPHIGLSTDYEQEEEESAETDDIETLIEIADLDGNGLTREELEAFGEANLSSSQLEMMDRKGITIEDLKKAQEFLLVNDNYDTMAKAVTDETASEEPLRLTKDEVAFTSELLGNPFQVTQKEINVLNHLQQTQAS